MQKGTTSGVGIGKCGPGCRDLKVVALWAPRQSFENRKSIEYFKKRVREEADEDDVKSV
jgi:hypothetical protein